MSDTPDAPRVRMLPDYLDGYVRKPVPRLDRIAQILAELRAAERLADADRSPPDAAD